jgi:hypothetical protein
MNDLTLGFEAGMMRPQSTRWEFERLRSYIYLSLSWNSRWSPTQETAALDNKALD